MNLHEYQARDLLKRYGIPVPDANVADTAERFAVPVVVGLVGVVGPTRMDYARSIGAVRYVGSLMSDLVRVMEGR